MTESAMVKSKIEKITDLGLIILKPEHNKDTFITELMIDKPLCSIFISHHIIFYRSLQKLLDYGF